MLPKQIWKDSQIIYNSKGNDLGLDVTILLTIT
jgi:hypothetical protein